MTSLVDQAAFLADVDAHIHELIDAQVGGAAIADAHASVDAGGKRLRPLLVMAARPVDVSDAHFLPGALRAAAAVELVHTASLVHDDLLDGAPMRRGIPTVGVRSGHAAATAVGDLLFSLAFTTLVASEHEVGRTRAERAVGILGTVARRLAEGEALQAEQLRDTTLTERAYLERCAGKTGVLFGAALQLGAVFGDASATEVETLGTFGELVGIAFQVADDALDCGDDAELLGKVPGADVRDGTMTLPMLHAMEQDPALVDVLAHPVDADDVERVLIRIRAAGGVAYARARALHMRDEALHHLRSVDDRFDTGVLRAIADRSVDRLT